MTNPIKSMLRLGLPIKSTRVSIINNELCTVIYKRINEDHRQIAMTVLPPLPKNPKPEDAGIIYRYMAEGIIPVLENERLDNVIVKNYCTSNNTITHAVDSSGERVEVAIVNEGSEEA